MTRSVTLSVPDLERSRRVFVDVLGLEPASAPSLHGPEHEALWGLAGAKRDSIPLWADDVLVELVQYADPEGRPRPPGYRISDQGLLNIAFGFRRRAEFEAAHTRCVEAGLSANGPPLRLGAWSVVYVNDDQGFSVELLHVEPWYERQMGFRPAQLPGWLPSPGAPRRACGANGASRRRWSPAPRAGWGRSSRGWRPRTRPRSCSWTATRTACRGWPPRWGTGRRWPPSSSTSPTWKPSTRPPPSWSPSTRTSTS